MHTNFNPQIKRKVEKYTQILTSNSRNYTTHIANLDGEKKLPIEISEGALGDEWRIGGCCNGFSVMKKNNAT